MELREPLAGTGGDRSGVGYVPNVVYSCGAMVHGRELILPYGLSDAAIGVAVISLPDLLAELKSRSPA